MINADELLFSVDENNNPIDPQPRGLSHQTGIWHRTSHIWVFNSKRQILCQQRSLLKDSNPGKWEPFFGGHLSPGQEYLAGALSELEEELGIQAGLDQLHLWKVYKFVRGTEFQGVFALRWDGDPTTLHMEKDEVESIEWRSIHEVRQAVTKPHPQWTHIGYEQELLDWLEIQPD